jgi:hypothetical protein
MMRRALIAALLLALLLLSGCGGLLRAGGPPIPGPTPSGTGTATPVSGGLPGGGDEEQGPAGEVVTDGPQVTG